MKAYIYHVPEEQAYWLSTEMAGTEPDCIEVNLDARLVRRILKAQQTWDGIQDSLKEVVQRVHTQKAGGQKAGGQKAGRVNGNKRTTREDTSNS
jgi:hypothetical protein